MKKTWKSLILAGILSLSMSVSAFAGSWQLNATGYWYQNDDGSYPTSCWKWIDGNNDGIAENYYFNSEGYLLVSTTTPDGYTVDSNGAMTINGVVQTQNVTSTSAVTQVSDDNIDTTQTATSQTDNSVTQSSTVWISATGSKYHRINNCGRMNPSKARSMSLDQAIQSGYDACSKCY
ncbi:MAG: hypothetical protein HFG68_08090 [Hungatella sp.]|nr:hypothetical protein [Hungatella sp.]